jgi:hypothetical protein
MGKLLDFVGWFFERRLSMHWRSWRSLAIVFPFIIGIFVTLPQAIRERRAATLQQMTQGTVTAYKQSNHNLCEYTFSVNEKLYNGASSAPSTDIKSGDQVRVYFDSQDPNLNALEGFTGLSERDEGFVGMLLALIAIVAAFISISRFTCTRAG